MNIKFISVVICLSMVYACTSEQVSLAEKEAIHYCKCAAPLAEVTKELMSERVNYRLEDSLKIEERMGELSRQRSQFTMDLENCLKDPKFQRYKDRSLQKMTSKEVENYMESRVVRVLKHCPEVAETLNSFKQ